MCIGENLREQVVKFQQTTGEESMVVVIEKHDESMAIHRIGFNPYVGLMVDGKPPSPQWWQEAEAFHPLQWPPSVVH
jgi:hypothetical protein